MKSIIEEASSIFKAIENAWKQAEQPAEFSVQIFETPQKNIFGFTTKSAKIGFFFDDAKPKEKTKPVHKPRNKPEVKAEPKPMPAQAQQPRVEKKPIDKLPIEKPAERPKRAEPETEPWSPEMVAYARGWMQDLLSSLGVSHKISDLEPQKYHLKVTMDTPLFKEEEKNRAFFRNCAHLMLQAVRNAYKRPLKGFKVILTVK